MSKYYGYAGKLLRVDLTAGKTSDEVLDAATARKWLGGAGMGMKYLYDEVPAAVTWDDVANRLILANGPLSGTSLGGSGTTSVVTKGPLTNGATSTQANGVFGAYLKFASFDGVILQGKSPSWVYLYIHDGTAELKDASNLVGKDTWTAEDLIRKELGVTEKGVSIAGIGPAGENLVKFAFILIDKGHAASKNGVGAVMGSKKIKAVVVARGRVRAPVKNKEKLTELANEFHDDVLSGARGLSISNYGTLNFILERTLAHDGTVPIRNYETNILDIPQEKLEAFSGPYMRTHYNAKPNPCWACKMHHCTMMTINEGPFKGYKVEEPEYECLAAFGPQIGVFDVAQATFLSGEADRLGLDCNEAGWLLGWAIECYEKGILTDKDTDGVKLTWGNWEAAKDMMYKIAERKGFGDVLAEGVMRAAKKVGGEAAQFAIHTMKGNTPRGHDHRNRWPILFDTCLSQTGTDEGYQIGKPKDIGLDIKPTASTNFSETDTLAWNSLCKGSGHFEDSLGICRFTTETNLKLLAESVEAATGWENFTMDEEMTIGRRILNLMRAFNMRHGHTAEMDAPSPRYGSMSADGPSKGKSIMANWNELRSKYYDAMGWDRNTGKPLPETLRKYGLEYVIPELWGK